MTEVPGFFTAFIAGLLSFLSPCVLPLIPSYLTVLTGSALGELRDSASSAVIRNRVLSRSIAFVFGFSSVFIFLGFALSSSAAMLGGASRSWSIAAGIAIVILGLNIVFDFLKILNFEGRFHAVKRPTGFFGAFAFGSAFAAGWSPCVGPILASILLLAGKGTSAHSVLLLASYSFGLALPFVLTGAFFGRLEGVLKAMAKRMRLIKIISGSFLVLIGVSMLLGNFQGINGMFARAGYSVAETAETHSFALRVAFTAVYALLALFPLVYRLFKKDSITTALKRPSTFISLIVLGGLCVVEALGILKSGSLLASWLLYQGV
ncbi:MAG: cytochrome c biogenesis protein CcdA [Treponemataceae bacterium]